VTPSSAAKVVSRIFLAFLLASAILSAQAQTFTVLHTFKGADGASPEGALVLDNAGNIYGTTVGGGSGNCSELGMGCGTAFMLNKAGQEVGLYSFKGTNGYGPMAGLLRDAAGNLYGTTINGGEVTDTCGGVEAGGCGVAFRLTKIGKEDLYKFKGTPDGYFPESALVKDTQGNFYGTTYMGGANGLGSVFKIDARGEETILYSFAGPPSGGGDGAFSREGVIRDAAGNLYGVADAGAYDAGVVYELDASGNETLLYNFTGLSDGGGPASVLLLDSDGNLYGTTTGGGNLACQGGGGCGVVFELSPQPGGTWTEAVLYTFCSLENCADGERPLSGPLVMDSTGNLYGATYFGGAYRNCDGDGCGVVFKLDTTGDETVLHSFTGGADGALPYAGVTMDKSGNLYGATQGGVGYASPLTLAASCSRSSRKFI
jgi:uncharacterized repeat protein (TIGR03803 family)